MIYRVVFKGLSAFYGPMFPEADDEWTAIRKSFDSSFSDSELRICASARPSSEKERDAYRQAQRVEH